MLYNKHLKCVQYFLYFIFKATLNISLYILIHICKPPPHRPNTFFSVDIQLWTTHYVESDGTFCVSENVCVRKLVCQRTCVSENLCLRELVSPRTYVSENLCLRELMSPRTCVTENSSLRELVSPRTCVSENLCLRELMSPRTCVSENFCLR